MTKTYRTRTAAARAAQKEGKRYFRVTKNPTHREHWSAYDTHVSDSSAYDTATAWAKTRDYVHHIELTHRDEGREAGYIVNLVITCTPKEIEVEDISLINELGWILVPATPELFESEGPIRKRHSTSASREPSSGPRSTIESPTKVVWEIADSMPGADRAAVIAACVERGINKSTATTQMYRWAKARAGS